MPVLIDGQNLIGRLPDISLADPSDEAQLVSRLQGYAERTGKWVTVVFDRGMPGGRSRALSGRRVEVVFAPTGRKADRILVERIQRARNPRGLTVVTSDRQVMETARNRGARVVQAEAFVSELEVPTAPRAAGKGDVHLSPDEVEEWLELFEEGGS